MSAALTFHGGNLVIDLFLNPFNIYPISTLTGMVKKWSQLLSRDGMAAAALAITEMGLDVELRLCESCHQDRSSHNSRSTVTPISLVSRVVCLS